MLSEGRDVLRDDRGFTLVELLVAMVVGITAVLGAFTLFDSAVRATVTTSNRVDAAQRGRLAMDRITQELRSQVCLQQDPSVIDASSTTTDSSVDFYADFSNGAAGTLPQKRRLSYVASSKSIVESIQTGTSDASTGTVTWATARTNTILENVIPDTDGSTTIPVFQVYPFGSDTAMATPLDLAKRKQVTRIAIRFRTLPPRRGDTPEAISLDDDVFVRSVDPNDSNPVPAC